MSIVSLVGRVATGFVFSATLAFATENRPLAWGDLVDEAAQTFADPYLDLTHQQMNALRTIVRNRTVLNDLTLSEARVFDSAAKINGAIEETNHSFRIVDGDVPMQASYTLAVTKVETAPVFGFQPQATSEWATSIAERLRASGQPQSKGTTSNAESP